MLYFEITIGALLIITFVHFQLTKKKNNHYAALVLRQIDSNEEMKKTLAMGLYLRFKKHQPDEENKLSNSYIKEDPYAFEHFAASLLQKAKGGSTWVSPSSGDYGVDIEHNTDEGLFLGQVKCYQGDLPFEPIALIHSNMIKKDATGGYVITTGSFTPSAKKYAVNLNIELIDGVKLVELWITGLNHGEDEIRNLTLETN